MNVHGLILAGGASRRMGTPKALLTYRGETFLDRLIGLFVARCSRVTVVLGHEPDQIRSGLKRAVEVDVVVNTEYQRGQFSSLQSGLRQINAGAAAVMFTPVDYPAISAATVDLLVQQFAGNHGANLFVIPRCGGRRGHPVLFDASVVSEFLALPPDSDARELVHRYRARTVYADVDDAGVLRDVDDPQDYADLVNSV